MEKFLRVTLLKDVNVLRNFVENADLSIKNVAVDFSIDNVLCEGFPLVWHLKYYQYTIIIQFRAKYYLTCFYFISLIIIEDECFKCFFYFYVSAFINVFCFLYFGFYECVLIFIFWLLWLAYSWLLSVFLFIFNSTFYIKVMLSYLVKQIRSD